MVFKHRTLFFFSHADAHSSLTLITHRTSHHLRSGQPLFLLTYPGTHQGTDTVIIVCLLSLHEKERDEAPHLSSHRQSEIQFKPRSFVYSFFLTLDLSLFLLPPLTHARKPVIISSTCNTQHVSYCAYSPFSHFQKKKKVCSILSLFTRIRVTQSVSLSLCLVLNALHLLLDWSCKVRFQIEFPTSI